MQRTIGWKRDSTREFGLEGMKERLGVRIVPGAPDAGTLQEAELRHLRAKGCPHVLRAAITMEDHATPGPVPRSLDEHLARDRRGAASRQ